MMRRKKHEPGPGQKRVPHPDPRVEIRLQRIIALRESAARRVVLIEQYRAEIEKLSYVYRDRIDDNCYAGARNTESRMMTLQNDIRLLESEIDDVHASIAKHAEDLNDVELSYL